MSARLPASRLRFLGIAGFFAAFLLLAALLDAAWIRRFTPWSVADEQGGSLTGAWQGELALGGDSAQVLLLLERAPDEDGPKLVGTARYCGPSLQGEFDLWGDPDRDGQVADLRFRPVDEHPVWLLHATSASWQGDRLVISGTHSFDPTARHIARSDAPEPKLTLSLRRGDAAEFGRLCTAP